ncbi:hypothetical protein RZO50_06865 [Microbacterium sp. SSW1-59]|uniref:hypothetical protein n=1 Tax=Microbacterium xanthum TaxID=3079794 RepID=UPI002AD2AA77|nr:hypothetical protein [Microbacterium sp. SSW1-59]MDZ8201229.1 hypothetical protein [Microbacterium sp. SSW1-59]
MTTPATPRPASYLRLPAGGTLADAVALGADGVSCELSIRDERTVLAGDTGLEALLIDATRRGVRVELVAGGQVDFGDQASLIAASVATLVSARLITPDVRLTSLDHRALTAIGGNAVGLRLGLRHVAALHRGAQYAALLNASSLHPLAGVTTREDVAEATAEGIPVHAWTIPASWWPVPEREQYDRACAAGVDAVTISDPGLLRLRDAAGEATEARA